MAKANSLNENYFLSKNKEKIRQLNREWRLGNREYDLKRKQDYRKKNREMLNGELEIGI